jgi:hypothetical protein
MAVVADEGRTIRVGLAPNRSIPECVMALIVCDLTPRSSVRSVFVWIEYD